jgi:hypothetical protein
MDTQWVKIRSWHALRPHDHFGPTTYCGRDAEGREVRDELPSEKSCESCLRIVARIQDAD